MNDKNYVIVKNMDWTYFNGINQTNDKISFCLELNYSLKLDYETADIIRSLIVLIPDFKNMDIRIINYIDLAQ